MPFDKNAQGNSLIFLISQPRAGSTMLQRMLAGHREICTAGETWLMLYLLQNLPSKLQPKKRSDRICVDAVNEYLQTINDRSAVLDATGCYASSLYEESLRQENKTYFLDKTPRYYQIIDELGEMFPQAKFVFLLRNPLAVACSIERTWAKGRMRRISLYEADLVEAPRRILSGIHKFQDRSTVVRYEDLVTSPEWTINRLLHDLKMPQQNGLSEYGNHGHVSWKYGDNQLVNSQSKPKSDNHSRWLQQIGKRRVWRLASDYLKMLGQDTVRQMGYDFHQLEEQLTIRKPSAVNCTTVPLSLWLKYPRPKSFRSDQVNRAGTVHAEAAVMGIPGKRAA